MTHIVDQLLRALQGLGHRMNRTGGRTGECTSLPDIFKLSSRPRFERRTERVASGADWAHLHRCRRCGQRWRIDAWDKYWPRFVIRIPDSADWEAFDPTPVEKDFLLRSRGGVTEEECEWKSCTGKRVKDVAFCIDHLYDAGRMTHDEF